MRSCPRTMAGQAKRSGTPGVGAGRACHQSLAALVAGRLDGAVRGYRKARDVRSLEAGRILNVAVAAHFHRTGVAEYDAAHFALVVVATFASLEQAALERLAVGAEDLHPAVGGEPQRERRCRC